MSVSGFQDLRVRNLTTGTATFGSEAVGRDPALAYAVPRTFSGVDHEARYQAPEVLAEALERERDVRWVRLKRWEANGITEDSLASEREAFKRAMDAMSLDVLRALDMKALGIPCVRCGRNADDHPEFPLCVRSTTVDGSALPAEPPPAATAQASSAVVLCCGRVRSVGVPCVRCGEA